jgi:hypothetical protein
MTALRKERGNCNERRGRTKFECESGMVGCVFEGGARTERKEMIGA